MFRTVLRHSWTAVLLFAVAAGCARGAARETASSVRAPVEVTTSAEAGNIQWLRYFEALGVTPKAKGRLLMLYFMSRSCGPCEMMQKWTFTDERVLRAVEGFVPVKIRGDIELQAVRRFGVRSFPTIVFFDAMGGEIDRKTGFRDADFLLAWMDEVKANKVTLAALGERLEQDPDDLGALLEQARNYLDADRLDSALELARRAEALAPEDADVPALFGLCYLRGGRLEEAAAAIDAALKMDAQNEDARRLKIAILLNRADRELLNDNAGAAMEWFSAVLEMEPDNFDALIGAGRALIGLDRGPSALERLKQAAETRPVSPLPHDVIGDYYEDEGEDARAEKEFLKAIDIESRYEPPYFRLIELYERQGRRDEMMDMYERVLPLSPAGAHNEIAWFMATSKHPHILDPEAAIKYAGMAVELEPRPWYIDTLAEAYHATGRHDAAIAIIKEAIAKEPDDLQYYENQLKKFQDAKADAPTEGKEGR